MGNKLPSRAVRLLEMMTLLKERSWTVRELAERFEVSERTVRRDLQALGAEPFWLPLSCERRWRIEKLK